MKQTILGWNKPYIPPPPVAGFARQDRGKTTGGGGRAKPQTGLSRTSIVLIRPSSTMCISKSLFQSAIIFRNQTFITKLNNSIAT